MTGLLYSIPDLSKFTKSEIARIMDLIKLSLLLVQQTNIQTNEPMGLLLSGFIAETLMQHLESIALPWIQHKVWMDLVYR